MIAAGHPPAAVWNYTPRELSGWLSYASRRLRKKTGHDLSLHFMAARGDPRAVRKQVKDMGKDS